MALAIAAAAETPAGTARETRAGAAVGAEAITATDAVAIVTKNPKQLRCRCETCMRLVGGIRRQIESSAALQARWRRLTVLRKLAANRAATLVASPKRS